MHVKWIFSILFYSLVSVVTGQNTSTTPAHSCNPATGICSHNSHARGLTMKDRSEEKNMVKVIYYTDPICSACWGIEAQLRKLQLEYGHALQIEYKMGGLLKDWSYISGGISKPSDVAPHWEEASHYYGMPIDGDIWLEDPLTSSFPASIAYKGATLQDEKKAKDFLRIMRQMVFMEKKNISRWEVIAEAAEKAKLDTTLLRQSFDHKAKELFENDLTETQTNGIAGFPTLLFIDHEGNIQTIYGSKAYPFFETAILTLLPEVEKKEYNKEPLALFQQFSSLTFKEFQVLSGLPKKDAEMTLQSLTQRGDITEMKSKNGSLWKITTNQ